MLSFVELDSFSVSAKFKVTSAEEGTAIIGKRRYIFINDRSTHAQRDRQPPQRDIRVDLFLAAAIACHGASSASRNADGSRTNEKKKNEREREAVRSKARRRMRIEGKISEKRTRRELLLLLLGRKNKGEKNL